jgi:hypothetical protein
MAKGGRQEAEGRRKTKGRGQRAEGRREKAEGRRQEGRGGCQVVAADRSGLIHRVMGPGYGYERNREKN